MPNGASCRIGCKPFLFKGLQERTIAFSRSGFLESGGYRAKMVDIGQGATGTVWHSALHSRIEQAPKRVPSASPLQLPRHAVTGRSGQAWRKKAYAVPQSLRSPLREDRRRPSSTGGSAMR